MEGAATAPHGYKGQKTVNSAKYPTNKINTNINMKNELLVLETMKIFLKQQQHRNVKVEFISLYLYLVPAQLILILYSCLMNTYKGYDMSSQI